MGERRRQRQSVTGPGCRRQEWVGGDARILEHGPGQRKEGSNVTAPPTTSGRGVNVTYKARRAAASVQGCQRGAPLYKPIPYTYAPLPPLGIIS